MREDTDCLGEKFFFRRGEFCCCCCCCCCDGSFSDERKLFIFIRCALGIITNIFTIYNICYRCGE